MQFLVFVSEQHSDTKKNLQKVDCFGNKTRNKTWKHSILQKWFKFSRKDGRGVVWMCLLLISAVKMRVEGKLRHLRTFPLENDNNIGKDTWSVHGWNSIKIVSDVNCLIKYSPINSPCSAFWRSRGLVLPYLDSQTVSDDKRWTHCDLSVEERMMKSCLSVSVLVVFLYYCLSLFFSELS